VKKFLLFFIFILLFGCDTISKKDNEIALIDCPAVFFSTENNIFVQGDTKNLDMENIDYKASLNNYYFANNCNMNLEYKNYLLDLLFIVEPINPKDEKINLPVFVILYDNKERIIDRQYFRIKDNLIFNKETSSYETTEVITNLKISLKKNNYVSFITVGFVNIN
jgi:hypothetical protein|tara:strand:- start:1148 stop:1642 length:495 start_codon:yes stop_codon:yes gene_type:complete